MAANTKSPADMVSDEGQPWWRSAVIYQIYPRSFLDTNGDGVGDLPGIIANMDYIASLGVTGIWISPFFRSPMKDFGYDVSDYCAVDPIFGTLADFDHLLEAAHARGLKVIIDQVYAHTSDHHPWFEASRQDRDNAKADWYVWKEPKPDGSPPTNWQAVFGGPAWTWDARRQQYYMHNFLPGQPQLNVHNPEVQNALLLTARFWLDRGVDGFRLDAINFSMHDPEFRDNPPSDRKERIITRPFDLQKHLYNQSHPDIVKFLERLRTVTDEYGAVFTVAEIVGPKPLAEMKAYTCGDHRLNSAYSFDFLYAQKLTSKLVRQSQANWPGQSNEGWPSWAFSNHDAPRCVSRWYDGQNKARYAKLTNALLLSLRGNPILYQGEELGMTQVEVNFADLKDPEAIANWPLTLGRDGARTPMAWSCGEAYAGFSKAKPWLPIGDDHADIAADLQEEDSESVLNFTRRFVRLRDQSAALRWGSVRFIDATDDLLVMVRAHKEETVTCLFNLGSSSQILPERVDVDGAVLILSGWAGNRPGRTVPPYSVAIVKH